MRAFFAAAIGSLAFASAGFAADATPAKPIYTFRNLRTIAADESLPYDSYVDRGLTPFTVTFRTTNGVSSPSSLTEFATPTNSNGEVKIRSTPVEIHEEK